MADKTELSASGPRRRAGKRACMTLGSWFSKVYRRRRNTSQQWTENSTAAT